MEKKMEQQIVTKTLIITVGMPCSGKTTWCKRNNISYVSRDDIREFNFIKPYVYSGQNEKEVTKRFDEMVRIFFVYNQTVALDNTHCKEKYIDNIIKQYPEHKIQIKFFDIGFIKAHYRNIVRRIQTGKWIPIKVMNDMYRNYKQINKEKYEEYNF